MMPLFLIQGWCTKDASFSATCRLNIFVSNLCYKFGAMKWSTANDLSQKILTTDETIFPHVKQSQRQMSHVPLGIASSADRAQKRLIG